MVNRFSMFLLFLLFLILAGSVPFTATAQVTGSGTSGTVPKFTGASSIGNSPISISSGNNVGISWDTPIAPLDVGGAVHVYGNAAQPTEVQGAFLNWNAMTGYTGETDLINSRGAGGGGFAFMNGAPSTTNTLMFLDGTGHLGIGTTAPNSPLTLAGSNTQNPNNSGTSIDYAGEGLTFVERAPTGDFTLGRIRIVQKNGYFLDNGDMVFTVGRTSGATLDAATIQGATGNIGIGTASPTSPLEVNGDIRLTSGSGHHIVFQDGSVQDHAWDGVLEDADFAESVDVTGDRSSFTPGDLLVIDPSQKRQFQMSNEPYSRLISGVYSTKPGALGRHKPRSVPRDAEVPMAMVGIVPTKVSTENGPVQAGDLLVSSSTPGYAMKGTDFNRMIGAVIGKALAPLETGEGVIEVLISLQ